MASQARGSSAFAEGELINQVSRRRRQRLLMVTLSLGLAVLAALVLLSRLDQRESLRQLTDPVIALLGALVGYYFGKATDGISVDERAAANQLRIYEEALETQKRALELELTKLTELQRLEAERASLRSATAQSAQ